MEIIYINAQDKRIARDALIRKAIQAGMQYVEMEDEVLIDGIYLVKLVEKDFTFDGRFPIIFNMNEQREFCEFKDVSDVAINSFASVSNFKKNDFKRESKKVNKLVKTKQYSNVRRRYK